MRSPRRQNRILFFGLVLSGIIGLFAVISAKDDSIFNFNQNSSNITYDEKVNNDLLSMNEEVRSNKYSFQVARTSTSETNDTANGLIAPEGDDSNNSKIKITDINNDTSSDTNSDGMISSITSNDENTDNRDISGNKAVNTNDSSIDSNDENKSTPKSTPKSTSSKLPSYFSWKDKGAVTPIRHQGKVGTCWAFATVGVLEINIKIKDKSEIDLSEQYLVSNSKFGRGIHGGWWAHEDFKTKGAILESQMPYAFGKTVETPKALNFKYKIDDWGYVSGSSTKMPTNNQIKTAIYKYGAVACGLTSDKFLKAYKGGVYDRDNKESINHSVVLIGWDDSKSAWIAKNSWGSNWGENGFLRIKYGVSNIGKGASFIIYKGNTPILN